MLQNIAFHMDLHCLPRPKWSSEKEIQYSLNSILTPFITATLFTTLVVFAQMYQFSFNLSSLHQKFSLTSNYLGTNTVVLKRIDCIKKLIIYNRPPSLNCIKHYGKFHWLRYKRYKGLKVIENDHHRTLSQVEYLEETLQIILTSLYVRWWESP